MTHRWFQFSLRRLLILPVLAIVLLTQWSIHLRPYWVDKEIALELQAMGSNVTTEVMGPRWIVTVLGDKRCHRVVAVEFVGSSVTDQDLSRLGRLTKLRSVRMKACSQVTEDGLRSLTDLPEFNSFSILGGGLAFSAIRHLPLDQLEVIEWGSQTPAGDEFRLLASCTELRRLGLYQTRLVDPGVVYLADLPRLDELVLRDITLRGEGVRRFQERRRGR